MNTKLWFLLLMPVLVFGQTISQSGNIVTIGDGTFSTSTGLFLPDTVWTSVGQECNIYFENITTVPNYHNYIFDVTCDSGKTEAARWTWTPASATSGNYALTVSVYANSRTAIEAASTVICVSKTIVTAAARRILIIGDSITDANAYTAELKDLAGDSLLFIGTQDSGTDSPNEGYPGYTYAIFESGIGHTSPFVHTEGGHVDFATYLSGNGLVAPNFVVLNCGVNDVFGGYTANIPAVMASLDSLVTAALRDMPLCKVVIAYPPQPAYSQDAWGNNYSNLGHRWFHKLNLALLNVALKAKYGTAGTAKNARVSLLPLYLAVDTEHNMQDSLITWNARTDSTYNKQSNGVHPAEAGYNQMADAVWGIVRSKW